MDVLVTTFNLAAIYGLVAIGISLAWAGLGFLNMAAGVTFTAGGYGAWWIATNVSSNGAAVLAAGLIMGALAGAIVFGVVFLPLDGRFDWDNRSIIAALALSFIGTNVMLEVFGPREKSLPHVFGTSQFRISNTVITADKSGAIISSLLILGLLVLALQRTRLGLGVRALTQNKEGAALVGIDRKTAAFVILAVSGALAGLSAVLLAGVFFVSPNVGFTPLINSFIVVLLGGLGSIPGTVIAAFLVGATEALTATYIGGEYVLTMFFVLIAVVLLVRPRGIGGILETTRA